MGCREPGARDPLSADAAGSVHALEDVARILRMPVSTIRALVEDGCLHRGSGAGEARFTFQDLVVLRAAQRLREAKVPMRRIRSALRGLGRGLPPGGSLTALRITSRGGAVVVHDGERAWNPESGQVLFDFAASDAVPGPSPRVHRGAVAAWRGPADLDADGWFARGCELETGGEDGCLEAYRRALDLDPGHFDANLNLGRCLHERGEIEEAVGCYRKALESRPDQALAAFNLGVAMEDLARALEAREAYELALRADPEFADAHFNVARLYEVAGDPARAVRHLKAYRRLLRRES